MVPALAAAPDDTALRDLAGALAAESLMLAGADHCDEQRAAVAPKLRAAVAAWRVRHDTETLQRRLASLSPGAMAKLAGGSQAFKDRMAREGPADTVCPQVLATLEGAAMDLRARFPGAYATSAPSATATPSAAALPAPAPVAAAGTVFNPAQISALVERGRQGKGHGDALRAVGLGGRILVRGTVVRHDKHHFIETVKGGFRSQYSVSTDNDLSAYAGREVVVSGVIKEWPISLVFLTETRVVADSSALVNSTQPEEPGLRRATVDAQAVRAAPGKGLAAGAVQGVHYRNYFIGSDLREETLLLLKDGTAYERTDVAPADLDVARSRELEPQRWLRWQGAGGGKLRVQKHDDHGKPAGDWQERAGVLHAPWPAGQLLDTAYTRQSFHGTLAFGGVYSADTLRFRRDGQFESSRFAQGGSGAVAATNGFSVGATSHSNRDGTRSSAGGGTETVTATSHTRRDDGAEFRGTYRIDGFTLELRDDSGRTERWFTYPMGPDRIMVNGSSYRREGAR
jgi:hypothetical protein